MQAMNLTSLYTIREADLAGVRLNRNRLAHGATVCKLMLDNA
jgi:hypothetical protein